MQNHGYKMILFRELSRNDKIQYLQQMEVVQKPVNVDNQGYFSGFTLWLTKCAVGLYFLPA